MLLLFEHIFVYTTKQPPDVPNAHDAYDKTTALEENFAFIGMQCNLTM